MVLRCNFSPDLLDSALNRVAQELEDSSLNWINNNDPSRKATNKRRAKQMVTFILIIHSYSYVDGVELFVKKIDGVERVRGGDCNSIKLEVTGKVDPFKVRELVEQETKKKVELIFPSAQMGKKEVWNQPYDEKSMKQTKMIYGNDIANKKTEESISVLKMKLCCDSCNQKVIKILQIKGLEIVKMDVDKDLITVKGVVDVTEIRSFIKDKLKKDVTILFPAEVVIPTKKGNSAAYKKDKDDGATQEKVKGSTAKLDRKYRGTITVDEKYKGTAAGVPKPKGIAAVDEKDEGRAATIDKKYGGTITDDEKSKGTRLVFENNKAIGAVIEENKGMATVDEKHKGRRTIDEKGKGNTTTMGKLGDKDENKEKYKDDESTHETHKVGDKETNYRAFDDGCKKNDDWRGWSEVNDSNELHLMFSDENPLSCCIT